MSSLTDDLNCSFEEHLDAGGTLEEWCGGHLPGYLSATYTMPNGGWICFHCGERFTTFGAAQDHFGETPDAEAGCILKVEPGKERGLLMALRRVEERNRELAICFRRELDRVSQGHESVDGPARAVVLLQSMLDEFGPSPDGAVERDMKYAIERLAKALRGDET